MSTVLLLVSLAAAGTVEALLLQRIAFHQAGGWSSPDQAFAYLLIWATVPLLWGALVIVAAYLRRTVRSVTRSILWVSAIGPALAYIALAQYSHSTPGFLLIGFAAQCIVLLRVSTRLYTARRRPENHA
jgi:hypothetical protein